MKSMCWDIRATDSIIKSGQKDTEASIIALKAETQLLRNETHQISYSLEILMKSKG